MRPFAEILNEYIEKCGLPIYQIEKKTKISNGYIGKAINGSRALTFASIENLADFFGLNGSERELFISSAISARARRQTRAVPVLDSMEQRLANLEREVAVITKEAQGAAMLAAILIEQLPEGVQKTTFQRLLRHLDRGPEKIEAAARAALKK